jgi:acetylornithine aminotransferase
VREICSTKGWLMMLDEIQTGMARTGRPFAYQHYDLKPDVMTVAKALANGVPIGACVAHGEAAGLFSPGNHGSTFGGNPLACAAALAVCEVIDEERLWEAAENLGQRIVGGLHEALADVSGVIEIRGQGLMIGIQLDRPCGDLVGAALRNGLLINVTAETVIRLLPPLIMSEAQADLLIAKLSVLVADFLAHH